MHNDWAIVFTTQDSFNAELIKNMLLSNNIKAIIINQKDSSYNFGEVKVYTSTKDEKKAIKLITE